MSVLNMKKFALVCGASGAIGQAISLELAKEGWSLYLHYSSSKERVAGLVVTLSETYPEQEFFSVHGDFTEASGAEQVAKQLFGLQAIVFANGQALYELLDDTTTEQMNALWQVHVATPMQLCKILAPKLRQHNKSYVLFISSIWGEAGASGEVVYSAVKGAQNSFVKAYAKEAAYNGIRVNAIAPGIIDTAMNEHLAQDEIDQIVGEIPLQRFGQTQEVAYLAAFTLSGKADYVTGQILRLNGGWHI